MSSSDLPVILGSSSKFRAKILAPHVAFTKMNPDIDEKAITTNASDRALSNPEVLTLAIARAKAEALCKQLATSGLGDALLITSDQVVVYKGMIREKPEDEQLCREYLKSYVDEPACTVTAVVVTNTRTKKQVHTVDIAKQWFHPVPDDVIDRVIAKGDIMYCAGGFMIDDPELEPFLGPREGTEDSIIGLPLAPTLQLLEEAKGEQ